MNRLAVGLFASLLLFLSLEPAQAATDSGRVVRATLQNGMHVILLPNQLAPVATTIMTYGVGSDDDTMPGVAHATEHMLFRGTSTLSAGQLSDIAARMGAQYNAQTSNEFTLYYFKLPSPYVPIALHIEADRMTHALIRAADWKTERGPIEQEIRALESIPGYKIGVKLRESFFKGTPFATAGGGTIPSFEKMTSSDIRSFYHRWYQPGNATLIVSGDIDPSVTLRQIHAQFDSIPAGPLPERAPIEVLPLAATSLRDTMDYPVGLGALAYRLPGTNSPDYAASEVLGSALQSGRGALTDLTATGKTLASFSMSNAFPEVGAEFVLSVPIQGATPQSAQTLIANVVNDYRKDGIPADLVDSAKMNLLSAQAYRQASISGLGFAWAQAAADRMATPDSRFEALANVTKADVDRVLRTYFTPEHQVSVIIDAKPTSTTQPKVDPTAGVENVSYTPSVHEPLPRWATVELQAPLHISSRFAGISTWRFPNGIRVVIRRETTSPTVVVSGAIRTDALLYAPKGKDGVESLVDGMLLWGTKNYDRKTYIKEFDAISGAATLGTSFTLQARSKDFDRGMQLLAEGLLNPAFSPEAFSVVKSNFLQNVAAANKLPATKADLAKRLALYPPGDPRRRDITEQTVRSITLDDVKNYYRFAFRPDETALAIVGDVTPVQVEAIVAKYFGHWKAIGPAPSFKYPKLASKRTVSETVRVKSADSVQSQVTLKQRFKMRRSDADFVPLLLGNIILSGEGTGSLLFQDLRTRHGYVYSVDSDLSVNHEGAEFSISYASDPKNVNPANSAAIAIIKRMQRTPLSIDDVQRAKALLLAQRALPLDSYGGLASQMLSNVGYYDDGSDGRFWKALIQTTPAQIQRAMRRIDADHFLRIIVAPD